MTLQISFGSGILSGVQLGVNELASALLIGTQYGSIFTRKDNAQLFEHLAQGAGVRVRKLPPWLQNLDFARIAYMHGDNMRPITHLETMTSIAPKSLEGLATFIVLCCQWTHSPQTTVARLIKELVTGDLGPIIDSGSLENSPGMVGRKLEIMLDRFIRATIDSDAGSKQSMIVQRSLADLSMRAGRVSFTPTRSDRLRTSEKRLLANMLGHYPDEQELRGRLNAPELGLGLHHESRVHDTVSISSATIALAAAANHADVYVECHTDESTFYYPKKPVDGFSNSTKPIFLVRLWLCQPPSAVSNFIDICECSLHSSSNSPTSSDAHVPIAYPTIFGGELELSTAIAEAVGFAGHHVISNRARAISQLWAEGIQNGTTLQLRRSDKYWQPDLFFEFATTFTSTLPDRVVGLARLLTRSSGRRENWANETETQQGLVRQVATIIDQVYRLDDYDRALVNNEIMAASALVKFAMTVGALQRLTHSSKAEMIAYALNVEHIEDGESELWKLLPTATGRGTGLMCLIEAACALWTGTRAVASGPMLLQGSMFGSTTSKYSTEADHRVMGRMGPHGIVMLDILRDPVEFAKRGLNGPVLFFTRGSVPLLARDPRDGYILNSMQRIIRNVHGIELESEHVGANTHALEDFPDPVLTIEPDTSDGLRSTMICCWFAGDLAFEIDPIGALLNVCRPAGRVGEPTMLTTQSMFREEDNGGAPMGHGFRATPLPSRPKPRYHPRRLTPQDLLKKKGIIIKNGSAVFKASSPAWLLCAAALIPTHSVSVTDTRLNYENILLDDGQVVIEYCNPSSTDAEA